MGIKLSIISKEGEVKADLSGKRSASIGYKGEYNEGDQIVVEIDKAPAYIVAKLDGSISESLVYMPENKWVYNVITETEDTAFNPNVFKGVRHALAVRYAKEFEIAAYRNLAFNAHDQKDFSGVYPHATANIETRNDSTFFAINAIDGVLANDDHGSYPFQSWGINQDPKAELRVDFGRTVLVDSIGLVLRGDYPHDSYWTEGTFRFSDGSKLVVQLEKLMEEQVFNFHEKEIEWLTFSDLIKAEDDSPFPALTQLLVYGKNK